MFGKNFEQYKIEAKQPLLIAMIENYKAVEVLGEILDVEGLDGIMIGPYDLSASLGITGEFDNPAFISLINEIITVSKSKKIASGVHVVSPSRSQLRSRIAEGYQFIAYSIDAVMLCETVECPELINQG